MILREKIFKLLNDFDVVMARQCAREMAREIGFGLTDQTRIATAVSEMARRILSHDDGGSIAFAVATDGFRRGVEWTCWNCTWLNSAANTGRGQTLGGVERLVDDLVLEPHNDNGLAVIMRKWLPREI
jgi:serine/threonine-protein kinase RsbT